MNNENTYNLTEFDIATSGTYLQMIKAYIPFTNLREQKILSVIVRIMELMQTIDFYKNLTEPSPLFRNCTDKENILNEIKKFCPKEDLEILNMITNYKNMSNIINIFQNQDKDGTTNSSDNNMFKSFLSKDQQDLFEKYKKILNS